MFRTIERNFTIISEKYQKSVSTNFEKHIEYLQFVVIVYSNILKCVTRTIKLIPLICKFINV